MKTDQHSTKGPKIRTPTRLVFSFILLYIVLLYSNRSCLEQSYSTKSCFQTSVLTATSPYEAATKTLVASLFSQISNFEARYTNGNRSKGIKISHWNKGGSYLINKMPEIKNIISQHKPHIFGISEANLLDVHDPGLAAVQDYHLHICPTISNPSLKTSRVVVYTHKDIVAKLRPDLMSDKYSSIWLEVGLPNHKRLLVSQSYRETMVI